MQYKDYYEVMGLTRDATPDQIRRAYRKLARKHHPDMNKAPDAEARFKELGEAYEVLKDPPKRAAYDELGQTWNSGQEFTPPPQWGADATFGPRAAAGKGTGTGNADFSDFFESLFGAGAMGAAPKSRARTSTQRGEDHHARILIDIEDSYHGAQRNLKLRVPEQDAEGQIQLREHTVSFDIPRGVRSGQQIRLTEQGAPSATRGPRGDLYLEVAFNPHPLYRAERHDIYMDVPIAPWEAALGAEVEVPTPTGRVTLTIPAGSKAGQKLRFKGKGLPATSPGDLYFVLQLVLPAAPSSSDKAAYRQLAQQFKGFEPRAALVATA